MKSLRWERFQLISGLMLSLFAGISSSLLRAEDPFASAVRPTDAKTPEEEQKSLHVPPGFRVQLFAAEPEIQKPLNMAFDACGRLWVSGTVDYPFPDLKNPGDSIRILEDTDQDGKADKITHFVENIPLPMGLLPYQDGVIAFSLPEIWFFRDTDGDGKCDQREKLYGPFDFSRDTHGLNNAFRRGFDGWIYACHGFNNHSVVAGKDGNQVDMPSGNTYRFRPDGSRIEHYSHGQINPFGMTFDARGDLYDSDCHTKPLMFIMREGQYPGFGRQHDGLGFVPAIMHHSHGSTAIAGVTQATDKRIPEEFRDNFFSGNVMTSRVNRDTLTYSGSSMTAVEQEDFVISDDPWFRPVDLQLGPDGAIYVADFYNKIIGHYEVPLTHPERDRTRGRIWRIEYVGDAPASKQNDPIADLTQASLEELVQAAGSRNLPRRMKAIDELTDRLGNDELPSVIKALHSTKEETARISLLWALQRRNALPVEELLAAGQAESTLVRLHAQRILADASEWTDEQRKLAQAGLRDPDPFVQRAAADALGSHPAFEQIPLLLDRWQTVGEKDPMLAYQLKIALRGQLREKGMLIRLQSAALSPQDRMDLANVCLAVDNHEAARFILVAMNDPAFIPEQRNQLVERMAKWLSPEELHQLIQILRTRHAEDLDAQLSLLQSVQQGLRLQKRGDSEEIRNWGHDLFQRVLAGRKEKSTWTVTTTPPSAASPWDFETRQIEDGTRSGKLLSSLPGGERAVSILRSPGFEIPAELQFVLCGHLGFPDQPAQLVNYVRLCLVEGDEEVARALPPRNDVARTIHWDLKNYAGKRGYLEVVDGLDLGAYAWLAFGRLQPNVAPLPPLGFAAEARLLMTCSALAAELNMQNAVPELQLIVRDPGLAAPVRGAAAKALARFDSSPIAAGVAALWDVSTLTPDQLAKTQAALLDPLPEESRMKLLGEVTRTLATREQIGIAQAILSRDGGAAVLLKLCESETLSPRILVSSVIQPQIDATKNNELLARAKTLVQKLPPASAEREEKVRQLIVAFTLNKGTSVEVGKKVFEARCAACHQIQGVGKIIGPQLDGIGSRGAERLFEDVIDPNRNVDHSFRSRTYALSDGQIKAGIFRRKDGPLIVIADNKGEEHSFAETEIEEQAESNVSIMPDNWADIIPKEELFSLMTYLLQQKK